eukprot:6468289-Amphidinium_carterae.3
MTCACKGEGARTMGQRGSVAASSTARSSGQIARMTEGLGGSTGERWEHNLPSRPGTSSTVCAQSFGKKRLVTSLECYGVHGMHVHKESAVCKRFQYPHVDLLEKLEIRQRHFLVGNALLLPVVAAWTWYCMSNLELRSDVAESASGRSC